MQGSISEKTGWFQTVSGIQYNYTSEHRKEVKIEFPHTTEGKIEFGHFGPAKREVAEASGQAVYNLKIDGKYKVVLSKDGTEFYYWDNLLRVEKFKSISQKTLSSWPDFFLN